MIHIANYTASRFKGWVRTTVDYDIPDQGQAVATNGDVVTFIAGERTSGVRVVDVDVDLQPGIMSIDMAKAEKVEPIIVGPSPTDIATPTIYGKTMDIVTVAKDGAAYTMHMRGRPTEMLCCDLWLRWYPDNPTIAYGEVAITASNGSIPDMGEMLPEEMRVEIAGAHVMWWPIRDDMWLADGQSRCFPIRVVFSDIDRNLLPQLTPAGICAYGLEEAWPEGNPHPVGDPLGWTRQRLPAALESLSDWRDPVVGVAAWSGRTGAQEDQVWPGGELVMPVGLGAEFVRYCYALGQGRRPNHHLEANGEPLRLDGHPDLIMWDGRAHYHPNVGSDKLGKPRSLSRNETHGWWGPDEEHWLLGTLTLAARATGSPACQWLLEHEARSYIFHVTTRQGPSRAVGWRGINAVRLAQVLDNETTCGEVATRWIGDADQAVSEFSGKPFDIWQTTSDPRLRSTGWETNAMPYQQSVGCYGLDVAGEFFGHDGARDLAFKGAMSVLDNAWSKEGHRWKGWGYLGYTETKLGDLVEGAGAHWGKGIEVWHVLGIATVLRREPFEERAMAIMEQFIKEHAEGGRWLPPEFLVEGSDG